MQKFEDDKILKIAFLIGGVYDLAIGIMLLVLPDILFEMLDATKPEDMIFAQLTGLFLLGVGYFLVYAAYYDVRKLAFIGLGSCLIRFAYAAIVILTLATDDIETGYVMTAATDIITALIILIPLLLTEGVSWTQLWQYE
ncbi:MAG: hypothetical protein ACFFGZ_07415 [Candidatus Thorarchaeota archaeon]